MADITDGQLTSIRVQCLQCAIGSIETDLKANELAVMLKADKYFEWVTEPVSDT